MKTSPASWALPIIDMRRCTGCGVCEQLCPTHAIVVREGRPVIAWPQDCSFCEICESYCPEGAIGRPFTVRFAPT